MVFRESVSWDISISTEIGCRRMDKKKIGIIAGVIAVAALAALVTFFYRQGDHSGPSLTLREEVRVGYGQRVGLYDIVRSVADESAYDLRITAGGDVAQDGRSTVFSSAGGESVEITAEDEHGNRTVKSAVIQVTDEKPPVIYAKNLTVDVGEIVDYLNGVTAEDEMDGSLTNALKVDSSQVVTTKAGVYPVTYRVSDRSGNEAMVTTALTIRSPEARSVSLNRQNLSLDGNGHFQLSAQVEPAGWTGKIKWESSDTDVAVVSDGLVTWTGRGACTITATAGDVSAQCEVECGYVTVASIHLSRGSMELNFGESDRVRAYIVPSNWYGDVIWSSSDTTVASVSDGVVQWNGQGECVITATADGRNASCSVTCNEPTVQGVTILEEEIALDSGQTYQIIPQVLPEGWPGELVWTSSDPNVASVADGLVRWNGEGTCVITASAGPVSDSVTIICERPFLDGLLDGLFGTDSGRGTGEDDGTETETETETLR